MFSRARSFFFAAAAALAFAAPAPAAANRTIAPVVNASKNRRHGLFNNLPQPSFSSLVGKSSLRISVAQVKRLAAKRRTQRRHKRHLRG